MARWLSVLALSAAFSSSSSVALQEPPSGKPPEEEYKDRKAKIAEQESNERFSIAEWLMSSGVPSIAREEYKRVLELSANHEKTRRVLGYRWNEVSRDWDFDPEKGGQWPKDTKKGDEVEKIHGDYQNRLKQMGKNLGKKWCDLGNWCAKAFPQEKEKALQAYRLAVDCDPLNSDARKKLGYQKTDKGWQSKEEIALRKEMREGIAKAAKGSPSSEGTKVESELGLKNRKQASEHILLETPHLDQKQTETLMQHAEHAYAIFHKVFGQANLFGTRLNLVVLKDKPQHENYVTKFAGNAPEHYVKQMKDSIGVSGGMVAEMWQGDRPMAWMEDWVIHHTIMECSQALAGGDRHWLHEGLAYYMTRLMHESAGTHCSDMRGTGAGSQQKSFEDASTWEIVLREWMNSNKDPEINEVFKATKLSELTGGEPVKAWSLCEFLSTEHREKFTDFMSKLRAAKREDDDKMFQEVFGWTLSELDARWKVYVRATYMDVKK